MLEEYMNEHKTNEIEVFYNLDTFYLEIESLIGYGQDQFSVIKV